MITLILPLSPTIVKLWLHLLLLLLLLLKMHLLGIQGVEIRLVLRQQEGMLLMSSGWMTERMMSAQVGGEHLLLVVGLLLSCFEIELGELLLDVVLHRHLRRRHDIAKVLSALTIKVRIMLGTHVHVSALIHDTRVFRLGVTAIPPL